MSKPNAVKFSFSVLAVAMKAIIIKSFDFDIQLVYPQLKGASEVVKLKGVCSLADFESFIENVVLIDVSYLSRLGFYGQLKFKLVVVDQNPAELPSGAIKEEDQKSNKK